MLWLHSRNNNRGVSGQPLLVSGQPRAAHVQNMSHTHRARVVSEVSLTRGEPNNAGESVPAQISPRKALDQQQQLSRMEHL